MVPLEWGNQYKTGVGFIDQSHERIFDLVNVLERPGRRAGDPSAEEALAMFLEYTGRHFREEEELMRFMEYPGYEAHRLDHEKAEAWIQVLKKEAEEGLLRGASISKFAGEWLTTHLRDHDLLFAQWTRESKPSKAMEQVFARNGRI